MTQVADGRTRGARAVALLVLAPLSVLVVTFGPAAVGMGLSGIRRGDAGRATSLLLWVFGTLGLIALASAVLPVALGKRNHAAVGPWRAAALVGGVVVSLSLLVTLGQWRGPPEKAYITLWVGYCALSALAGASWVIAHRAPPDRTR